MLEKNSTNRFVDGLKMSGVFPDFRDKEEHKSRANLENAQAAKTREDTLKIKWQRWSGGFVFGCVVSSLIWVLIILLF